eukprot:GILK01010806.1.p1 GENE.GILK01010806.1~~GILK01010806.1.p1  ORF type:complete len:107 (+),score=11.96 GILK01010806.1:40-321(+)
MAEVIDQQARMAVENVRSMLGCTMKIEVTDGRVMYGTFMCTDKMSNIILCRAHEVRNVNNADGSKREERRTLGLIMVPGQHVVKCEIDTNTFS